MLDLCRMQGCGGFTSTAAKLKGSNMLVLTRRADEEIRIGADIRITIAEIRGKSVRIGITAPKDISIVRKELEEKDEGGSKQ